MSSAPPIKFRCSQCNKLLGVSRSKVASVVSCPQCGTELIVPEPAESPPGATFAEPTPPPRPSPSSSRIDPAVVPWDAPPPDDPPPAPEPAFPAIQLEPISLRPDPPVRTRGSSRSSADFPTTPVPAFPRPLEAVPVPLPTFAAEPISIRDESALRVSASSVGGRDISPRRNDVVLPRTVVVLWSFLVLLALVFSFAAGLLAGRFLWSPGVKVAMPMSRAGASP